MLLNECDKENAVMISKTTMKKECVPFVTD